MQICFVALPALLSRESLIQQSKNFGNVELNVLQIKIFLILLLHFEEIIKFEIEFEQTSSTSYNQVSIK